jgi:hypothetical protein
VQKKNKQDHQKEEIRCERAVVKDEEPCQFVSEKASDMSYRVMTKAFVQNFLLASFLQATVCA